MPERHRTLREAIHRSYVLLRPDEQRLFRTLGVFAGGFDLAAVVGLGYTEQTLQVLINRSLVRFEPRFLECSEGIWGLADLANYWQQGHVAAQLLGTAAHLRQLTPDYFTPAHRRAYATTIASTCALLDETTYARTYAEGYAMPPDEAIAFALARFDLPQRGAVVNDR